MKIRNNDKAVSPVIGTILMVVITVIIAAIVAVFAFGIGTPTKVPQSNLQYATSANSSNTNLKITHQGGDPLVLGDEILIVKNSTKTLMNSGNMSAQCGNTASLAIGSTIYCGTTDKLVVGDVLTVQIQDKPSGQFISNTKVAVSEV